MKLFFLLTALATTFNAYALKVVVLYEDRKTTDVSVNGNPVSSSYGEIEVPSPGNYPIEWTEISSKKRYIVSYHLKPNAKKPGNPQTIHITNNQVCEFHWENSNNPLQNCKKGQVKK
jgi:hypothetical protein